MISYRSYTAHCTPVIRMKFPLLCRHFPAGEKHGPTTRTSDALLHRRCERINSLDCLGALVSRHHNSRPHRSLPSARQPARYSTTHSTTRPFSYSSPDRNTLENGPTCSLLLSSTMISTNLGGLLPFLRAGGLALTSLRASSYSSKTIRTIAR